MMRTLLRKLHCDERHCLLSTQSTGIDLSVHEMEVLIQRLDKDGDGEIDYA